ncbi:MAG: Mrp/NBP35 family ATP-binding protein [Bacillota bacterium]
MYQIEDDKFKLEHGVVNKGLIAVASGKGGVGKSTITVNLAAALSELGNKVGVIDADIRGFSVTRILGVEDKPKPATEKELHPPERDGIKVMSMGALTNEDDAIIWRAPLLAGTLEQFMTEVHWQELDYLLFDLPPGTGDMPLNVMQRLEHAELLVVTTPQSVATNVAGRIGKMADKLDRNILGVIENMSYYQCPDCGTKDYIFGQGGGKKLAKELDSKLLTELPLLTSIRERSDSGNPVVLDAPESEMGSKFLDVATYIDK